MPVVRQLGEKPWVLSWPRGQEGKPNVRCRHHTVGVAEGKTKVTVHGQADLEGALDLAEPVVERIGQRQWANSLENLKDVLEA